MTFNSFGEFSEILDNWLSEEDFYFKSAKTAGEYVKRNTGATPLIIKAILGKDINKLYS